MSGQFQPTSQPRWGIALKNILYDAGTQRITGLLDFDWAAVTHPWPSMLGALKGIRLPRPSLQTVVRSRRQPRLPCLLRALLRAPGLPRAWIPRDYHATE